MLLFCSVLFVLSKAIWFFPSCLTIHLLQISHYKTNAHPWQFPDPSMYLRYRILQRGSRQKVAVNSAPFYSIEGSHNNFTTQNMCVGFFYTVKFFFLSSYFELQHVMCLSVLCQKQSRLRAEGHTLMKGSVVSIHPQLCLSFNTNVALDSSAWPCVSGGFLRVRQLGPTFLHSYTSQRSRDTTAATADKSFPVAPAGVRGVRTNRDRVGVMSEEGERRWPYGTETTDTALTTKQRGNSAAVNTRGPVCCKYCMGVQIKWPDKRQWPVQLCPNRLSTLIKFYSGVCQKAIFICGSCTDGTYIF